MAKLKKKNKKVRLTLNERRVIAKEKAMPEVKRLVKKYNRSAIQSCLNSLREYDKKIDELVWAKTQVARLEKEIN